MKNKGNNLFLKSIKILFITFICIFSVSLLLAAAYCVKIHKGIDYASDERLFELSRGSKTTILYYNDTSVLSDNISSELGLKGYVPKEMENGQIWGSEKGIWCEYEQIPENLKNAFIAIEDHRFFSHNGVDWYRTGKAAVNYIFHFDSRFGGSTITQQLIKNISDDDEISAKRKLREMFRAINIEKKYSKEEILELYLNIVPMSENCVGLSSAADVYFAKNLSELDLNECAALAAIINSPSRYNPAKHPENNEYRRNLILQSMLDYGYITQNEFDGAYGRELVLNMQEEEEKIPIQSWYAEVVVSDVIDDLMKKNGLSYESASKMVYSGGLKIYTLMDREIQTILENYFSNYKNFPKQCRTKSLQYAMTVIDQKNGNLLGVVGAVGNKEANRVTNFATKTKMPPGSSIKPISVYAPALEEGLITWSTVFDDTPVIFFRNSGKLTPWPRNYPSIYSGLTDISSAIAYSKNTVAVKVFNLLGAERSYSYLVNKLHVNNIVRSAENEGERYTDLASAPLALGQLSYGVTLRDITNAYTSFSDGNYHKSRSYLAVYDSLGNLILKNEEEKSYVWSEQNASIMTQLLQNVVEYGTADKIKLKYSIDTAGKTGTSGDDRDKWFVGYTPYYTAGIWCGYPKRDKEVGDVAPTHLEVWDEVMREIHRKKVDMSDTAQLNFELAPGVVRCQYCRDSGKLYSDICSHDARGGRSSVGYFTKKSMPRSYCDCHILVDYDEERGIIIGENGEAGQFEDYGMNLKKVALIKEYKRDFPIQLYISDAQYVYRALNGKSIAKLKEAPFFANTIPKGRFVGISNVGNKRQFNSYYVEEKKIEEEREEETEENIQNKREDLTQEEENDGIYYEE